MEELELYIEDAKDGMKSALEHLEKKMQRTE